MIAAGYEDGNDASSLRSDPMFKMALDLSPSDRELCSQSTISRLENLPDARALLRMGRAMVDLYCESFRQVPRRITLDIDDTFDAIHGGQQLRLLQCALRRIWFPADRRIRRRRPLHHAVLRSAERPGGKEIRAFLRRLLRAIRANWPNTQTCCVATAIIAVPKFSIGVGLTVSITSGRRADHDIAPAYRRPRGQHQGALEAAPKDGKLRRFKEFFDGAASWSRVERIIARVEVGAEGPTHASSSPSENDATPVSFTRMSTAGAARLKTTSNRGRRIWRPTAPHARRPRPTVRLFLHAGAYWLMWGLRASMPRRSMWRVAQFDTLRLRLIKVAARIVEMKTMIRVHLPASCPPRIFCVSCWAHTAPRHLSTGA